MGFIPPNQLPEESIETDAFYNSYSNKNDCSYSEAVSASNTSRCFSSFNQSDAESAPQEVSSVKNDNLSETIEASVRKYCEDKSYDMFKPEIGMRFDTCEDAYKFYNMYSWVLGFSIRCGDNYTNTKKIRTNQEYKCQREGKEKAAKFSTTRCGCKAMIRLAICDDSTWYVKAFVGEHNHQLVESCGEKKHLSSHRHIDEHTKEWIRHLRENNVSLSRVNLVLGSVFGGNVPFSKKTLRTFCSSIASDALKDDVKKTMESFREMISNDPRFVFSVQLDDNDNLKSLMWTSGRSRSLYQYFGDAVTFDTTYDTNIYKMPFGMFVGVNNHFQSVIFAGVLLTNETSVDFKWAFEEFIAMMGGKAPSTILTDQCLAMTIAIRENLKKTTHRWCKWHVLRRAGEALGHVHKAHKTFAGDFNKLVNHMLTIEEFENGWEHIISKYGLEDNPFMIRAYEVRDKWAKPYFKEVFCARMTSTQRSESANHVLKVYVPCKSSINMFVKQYTKLIDDREKADDEAEKNSSQRTTEVLVGYPIEKHAAKIYTPSVFKLFKIELRKSASYVLERNNGNEEFEVMHVDAVSRDSWCKVRYRIEVNHSVGSYKCECGLFEHFGVICCHIIMLMINKGITSIPDFHIMKRWTKFARDGFVGLTHRPSNVDMKAISRTVRHKRLYMSSLDLVSNGQYDGTTTDIAMKAIEKANKDIAAYKSKISTTCQVGYNTCPATTAGDAPDISESADSTEYSSNGLKIYDRERNFGIDVGSIKAPAIKRKSGRPSNRRLFSHFDSNVRRKEKASEGYPVVDTPGGRAGVHQTRFCSACKSPDHDIRTCPTVDRPEGNGTNKKRKQKEK